MADVDGDTDPRSKAISRNRAGGDDDDDADALAAVPSVPLGERESEPVNEAVTEPVVELKIGGRRRWTDQERLDTLLGIQEALEAERDAGTPMQQYASMSRLEKLLDTSFAQRAVVTRTKLPHRGSSNVCLELRKILVAESAAPDTHVYSAVAQSIAALTGRRNAAPTTEEGEAKEPEAEAAGGNVSASAVLAALAPSPDGSATAASVSAPPQRSSAGPIARPGKRAHAPINRDDDDDYVPSAAAPSVGKKARMAKAARRREMMEQESSEADGTAPSTAAPSREIGDTKVQVLSWEAMMVSAQAFKSYASERSRWAEEQTREVIEGRRVADAQLRKIRRRLERMRVRVAGVMGAMNACISMSDTTGGVVSLALVDSWRKELAVRDDDLD